jgi:hypothetical protein
MPTMEIYIENLFASEALDSLGGDSDGGVSSGSE